MGINTRQEYYDVVADNVIANIKEDAAEPNPQVVIWEETKEYLKTDDTDGYGFSREIVYRKKYPTPDDLKEMLFIAPDVDPQNIALLGGADAIAETFLNSPDPIMLMTLRHIIVTTESERDVSAIAERMQREEGDICDFEGFLGMEWWDASAVVINVDAIAETVYESAKELHYNEQEKREEFVIGFYSTFLHELWHIHMDNPYGPGADETTTTLDCARTALRERMERDAEAYARRRVDAMLPELRRLVAEYSYSENSKPTQSNTSEKRIFMDQNTQQQPVPIYTHDEAAGIVELFEDILSQYDIYVPSPEDDDRDKDNMVGLYGSTYSDLLDNVEAALIDLLARHKDDAAIVPYMFSGNN